MSFEAFIGQEEVLRGLKAEVAAVRIGRHPLSHLLLNGPPGVGKTALAYVLAGELGMPVYESTGAEYPTQDSLFDAAHNISDLHMTTGRSVLWLIDEIDGMPRTASYVIFGLMTHGYIVWRGRRFGGVPISILGTTNSMASVSGPLKSRFGEALDVDFYTPPELAEIARRSAIRMGFALTPEAAQWIGENAGGEPRKVNRRILRNVLNLSIRGTVGVEGARAALALSGLRHRGLTRKQFEVLEFLSKMKNGTAGLASLSAYLGRDAKDVQFDIEPYLIRAGYVRVGRSGRELTDQGLNYLKEANLCQGN